MKNRIAYLIFGLIILFIVINNIVFMPQNVFSWDVFGYYLYLPFKFIYNDIGLHNYSVVSSIIEKYQNTGTFYQAVLMPNGNYVMKYSMGLAFFYAPFFFIGHIIAIIFNYPIDGFSIPYQYSVFIGGILYSIIGIWALLKVLQHFFNSKISILTLLLIVFSTNYLIHITMYGQNAMSHNYLFTTYALIIWFTIKWHETKRVKHIILLAVLCGLTILSRPSEIVCLIIPLLWNIEDFKTLKNKAILLLNYKYQIIIFALIIITIGLSQLFYWKIFAGKFVFNSYGGNAGEGFEFFSPNILNVLFSFRKGWLIYTPIMILAILGFYSIFKNNRSIFYALLGYFILNLYIVSSWSCWWYAQSFGQRALIQSYPIMAIGLGYFLLWMNKKRSRIISGSILLFGFIVLNLFQTLQFHKGTISGDRMTGEYYFRVFGKLHSTFEDQKLLLIQRSFSGFETFTNKNEYKTNWERTLNFEDSESLDSTLAYKGTRSFKLDSNNIYSPSIEVPYMKITSKDHAWIRVTGYVYPTSLDENNLFSLVVHFSHKGFPYKFASYNSENMKIELNKWNKISFDYLTPEVRNKKDLLRVYFWNRGKSAIYVDDLQIKIFEQR